MLSCSGTMDYKLMAEAGLVCGQDPATAVLLRLGTNDTPCYIRYSGQKLFYNSMKLYFMTLVLNE
jgi:hypothetical protein